MTTDHKNLLKTLADLVQPLEEKEKVLQSQENAKGPLELTPANLGSILSQKLPQSESEVKESDVRWRFVEHALAILEDIAKNLKETQESQISPDIFSVREQQSIGKVTQLIVSLGVLPSLIPGVGLPAEKRSRFMQRCLERGSDKTLSVEEVNKIF